MRSAVVGAALPDRPSSLPDGSGECPVCKGFGSLQFALAPAALVLSPHHGDITHFYNDVVSSAGAMPVVAYHHPSVSPHGIPIDTLKSLKVAGLKDSSGNPERLLEELAHLDQAGADHGHGCVTFLQGSSPEKSKMEIRASALTPFEAQVVRSDSASLCLRILPVEVAGSASSTMICEGRL